MKIVIDIPEEDYKGICHLKNEQLRMLPEEVAETLMRIANGTPLPKGYGDLIDRQTLIDNGINKGFCDWYDEIKMADAIIEADTGETK